MDKKIDLALIICYKKAYHEDKRINVGSMYGLVKHTPTAATKLSSEIPYLDNQSLRET